MTILQGIEKFLLTEVAADNSLRSLGPDEDLLEKRVIDSLGILKLVSYIEKAHGIRVLDEDIIPENFQSLQSMTAFVEQKMQHK